MNVDTTNLIRVEDIPTGVRTDAAKFVEMANNATDFMITRPWGTRAIQGYLDRGLADVIAIFYYEFEPTQGTNYSSTWLINGVLPLMVVPPDVAAYGMQAIEKYLAALELWGTFIREGKSVDTLPPVYYPNGKSVLPPTSEHADYVIRRVASMREQIVPWLTEWTPDQD